MDLLRKLFGKKQGTATSNSVIGDKITPKNIDTFISSSKSDDEKTRLDATKILARFILDVKRR